MALPEDRDPSLAAQLRQYRSQLGKHQGDPTFGTAEHTEAKDQLRRAANAADVDPALLQRWRDGTPQERNDMYLGRVANALLQARNVILERERSASRGRSAIDHRRSRTDDAHRRRADPPHR